MSESSGAQDASTLFLRISVPAGAEYHAIVKELAAKVAAYLGSADPDGLLLAFLERTYTIAADLAQWDRAALECARGRPRIPRTVHGPA